MYRYISNYYLLFGEIITYISRVTVKKQTRQLNAVFYPEAQ